MAGIPAGLKAFQAKKGGEKMGPGAKETPFGKSKTPGNAGAPFGAGKKKKKVAIAGRGAALQSLAKKAAADQPPAANGPTPPGNPIVFQK